MTSRSMPVSMVRPGRSRAAAPASSALALAAANAGGLIAGALLDKAFGDPRRFHPVAGYGRAAGWLERRLYDNSREAGTRFASVALGVPVAAAIAVTLATRRRPLLRASLVAATTWAALGGTSLRREGLTIADALESGDLDAARTRLPHLCGRDPSALDEAEVARATIESIAENSSDAEVAPLVWGALAGLPGLVGYRAVNTLDAMVGHRSPRYRRFGWASARLDDLANLGPSRLTGALTVLLADRARPEAPGSRPTALRIWLRDGYRHPSPNAGQCEAAMAGALGVRLGGRNVYEGRIEERPILGDGPPPSPAHVHPAVRLSAAVGAAALLATAGHALATPLRRDALRMIWRFRR
jgi:adenosylcobinamide-phosphate synthase